MASLGWNDGTEQEIFTVDELIQKFDLTRVQHSGARFDEQRLVWMNGAHIRMLPLDDLYERSEGFWPAEANNYDEEYRKMVLALVQERLKYFAELPSLSMFFFKDLPIDPALWQEHKQLKKLEQDEIKNLLEQSKAVLEASDFSANDLTDRLNKLLEDSQQKPAVLFSLIRIATTQAPSSPGLAETLHVLGKETSLRRVNAMLATL
jgi:glutamyl-tRNA synthetase